MNLAHAYHKIGNYQQAVSLYEYVINDSRGGAYPQAIDGAYLGLAELHAVMENHEQALAVYREGINKVRAKTSLESEMALYENLAKLELKLGNYEAAAVVQAERDVIKLQEALLQQERDSRHASVYMRL